MDGDHDAMTFRRKLLAVFALTVFLSVGTVAWLVSAVTRKHFEKMENRAHCRTGRPIPA